MCPLCIANIAALAATSSGGVAALALKIFHKEKQHKEERQKYETGGNGSTESGVIARMGGGATTAAREGKGVDPRPRRAGRRASADAVGCRGERLRVRRTQGQGESARPFRWPPSVDCLPRVPR